MTDGEYNSIYCNGVIAQNSTTGSGSNDTRINCNGNNGSSYEQTARLCTQIKAQGIRVYTVGFAIQNTQVARQLMATCASESSYAYEANTGKDLTSVFEDIGRNLTQLRVSK
jgi:hypothetical protein